MENKSRFSDKAKTWGRNLGRKAKDKFKRLYTRPGTPESNFTAQITVPSNNSMPSLRRDVANTPTLGNSLALPGQVVASRSTEGPFNHGIIQSAQGSNATEPHAVAVDKSLPNNESSNDLNALVPLNADASSGTPALSTDIPSEASMAHPSTEISRVTQPGSGLVISSPLSSTPKPSKSLASPSVPTTSESSVSTALATACNVVKISLKFVGPFLEGLPIPAAKGIVETTLKIIELAEQVKDNSEAFTNFAARYSLMQDTLRACISGKTIEQLPKELVDSIGWFAEELEKILQKILNGKPSAAKAIIQADDYATLIKEANTSIDQLLQHFLVKNQIAGRLDLQDILSVQKNQGNTIGSEFIKLQDIMTFVSDQMGKHVISERIKQLKVAETASYDSYMDSTHERKKCFQGTRANLLNEISNWFTDRCSSPIYILDGIAGIGKSTVAQTIAEQAANLHLLGASFFFSRNDEQLKSGRLFFYTLAYQLACYDESIAKQIAQALEHYPAYSVQQNLQKQFTSLILNPLQEVSPESYSFPILIVIDALDECEARDAEDLLLLLAKSIHKLPQLKILITSRPEAHIQKILTSNTSHQWFHLHDIHQSIVESDIQKYLNHQLSQDSVSKALPNLQPIWTPSLQQLQQLVDLCGKLFIIASTAVKYILDQDLESPDHQLRQLLSSIPDTTSIEPALVMDKFYAQILCAAVPLDARSNPNINWIEQYQIIVGSIVILQAPLNCSSMSKFLNIDASKIKSTLRHLHSLVAPTYTTATSSDFTFQVHHKSFPDFVTSATRIDWALEKSSHHIQAIGKKLYIKPSDHHLTMAKCCFGLIASELPIWNVCHLAQADWYHKVKVPVPMSQEAIYACNYWITHLVEAKELDIEAIQKIEQWAFQYFLSWLEVVCFSRGPSFACAEMIKLQQTMPSNIQQAMVVVQDGCRLNQRHISTLVEYSPMHLYWSALPMLPQDTMLFKKYNKQMQTLPNLILGGTEKWNQMITALSGHSKTVQSVAFAPDGLRLASGSADHTIRLWNAFSGDHIALLEEHTDQVNTIAFAPDSFLLASGSSDNKIRLWNGQSGRYIGICEGHTNEVNSVVFSPSGLAIASGSEDGTVRLWDAQKFTQIHSLDGHTSPVLSVTFSLDGLKLASGSRDNTIKLWNAQSPWGCITTLQGHSGYVRTVAFSPDSCFLASGSDDNTIRLWDIGSRLNVATLKGHSDWVRSVAFSADGSILASGADDRMVKLWDTQKGICIGTLEGHSSLVMSVSFSPVQNTLASGSNDNTVRLWDITSSKYHSDLGSQFTPEVPHPDNSEVAFVSDSKDTGAINPNLSSPPAPQTSHSSTVYSVAFSPDGCTLASGSFDDTVILWSTQTSSHFATLKGHSGPVYSVIFLPDGSILASGSDDQTIRLWNAKSGSHLAAMEGHTEQVWCVEFSPDGSKLASGSLDKTIRLWDVQSHSCVATLEGHTEWVRSVIFLQDGLKLVSCSDDRTVRLWDIQSESCIKTLGTQDGKVYSMALPPDGSTLAAQWGINSITAWNTMSNKEVWTFNGSEHSISIVNGVQIASSHIFAVVQREKPDLWGLVAFKAENDTYSDPVPFMWFPPDMPEICSFTLHTVDGVASKVAVGCRDGQVLAIDISKVLLP